MWAEKVKVKYEVKGEISKIKSISKNKKTKIKKKLIVLSACCSYSLFF